MTTKIKKIKIPIYYEWHNRLVPYIVNNQVNVVCNILTSKGFDGEYNQTTLRLGSTELRELANYLDQNNKQGNNQ